jgi:hypothetical protein
MFSNTKTVDAAHDHASGARPTITSSPHGPQPRSRCTNTTAFSFLHSLQRFIPAKEQTQFNLV